MAKSLKILHGVVSVVVERNDVIDFPKIFVSGKPVRRFADGVTEFFEGQWPPGPTVALVATGINIGERFPERDCV